MTLLRMIAFRPAIVVEPGELPESGDSGAEVAASAKKPVTPSPEPVSREAAVPEAVHTVGARKASIPKPPPPGESESGQAAGRRQATIPESPPRRRPDPPPPGAGTRADAAATAPLGAPAGNLDAPAENPGVPSAGNTSVADALEPARWADILDQLPLNGLVYNVASHCELRQVDDDRIYLVLDETNASLYNEAQCGRIAAAIGDFLGRSVNVNIEVGVPRYETPARRAKRLIEERQAQALAAIESDPRVQLLLERFEGAIDRTSVTPIKH
jgi:DNA polymerase-3 subunit gamma/tau